MSLPSFDGDSSQESSNSERHSDDVDLKQTMEVDNFHLEDWPAVLLASEVPPIAVEHHIGSGTCPSNFDWPAVLLASEVPPIAVEHHIGSGTCPSNFDWPAVLLASEVPPIAVERQIGSDTFPSPFETINESTASGQYWLFQVASRHGSSDATTDELREDATDVAHRFVRASAMADGSLLDQYFSTDQRHGIHHGVSSLEQEPGWHNARAAPTQNISESSEDTSSGETPVVPMPTDVCFGLMDYPGTNDWRAVVKALTDQDWSREVYDEVRRRLTGRRFLVCLDNNWYLAAEEVIFEKTQQRFRDAKKPRSHRKVGRPAGTTSTGINALPWTNVVNVVTTFLEQEILDCQNDANGARENQEKRHYKLQNLQLAKDVIILLNGASAQH